MTLLPPNATPLERAADMLAAARIGGVPVPLRDLWSAQNCPEELLPWLAWALSIDSWSPDWPLPVRRARVAGAIAIQRRKGTLKSVQEVIASFGGSVTLREWFETDPPGEPHTFQLELSMAGSSGAAPDQRLIDAAIAEVARTKPVRSHFTFNLSQNALGAVGLIGMARPQVYARLICDAA